MDYQDDLKSLRKLLGAENTETVEHFLAAFLETLGERLSKTERHLLGSQLPNEMKPMLMKRPEMEQYNLDEFYNRLAARAEMGYIQTVRWAKRCGEYLAVRVSAGELEQVACSLGPQFRDLFAPREEGRHA